MAVNALKKFRKNSQDLTMNYLRSLDDTSLRRALSGESVPALPVLSHPYFRPSSDPLPESSKNRENGILWRTKEFLENAKNSTIAKSSLTVWKESYTVLPQETYDKLSSHYTSHSVFLDSVESVGESDGEGWRLAAVLGIAERTRWDKFERSLIRAVEREDISESEEWGPKVVSLFFGSVACLLGLFPVIEGSHASGGATDVESSASSAQNPTNTNNKTPALEAALAILRGVPDMEHWSDSYLSPTTEANQNALDDILCRIVIGAHEAAWARIAAAIGSAAAKEKYAKLEEETFTNVKFSLVEETMRQKGDEYVEIQEAQEKRERKRAEEAIKWQKLTVNSVRESAKRDYVTGIPTDVARKIAFRKADEIQAEKEARAKAD